MRYRIWTLCYSLVNVSKVRLSSVLHECVLDSLKYGVVRLLPGKRVIRVLAKLFDI